MKNIDLGIKLEPTYYTPEIEEFCFDFEYEVIEEFGSLTDIVNNPDDHKWRKMKFPGIVAFGGYVGEWVFILADFIYKKYVRVKHLDRQDIEELDWTIMNQETNHIIMGYIILPAELLLKQKAIIKEWDDAFILTYAIEAKIAHISIGLGDFRFQGIIQNKSELLRLMKQLGIIK